MNKNEENNHTHKQAGAMWPSFIVFPVTSLHGSCPNAVSFEVSSGHKAVGAESGAWRIK